MTRIRRIHTDQPHELSVLIRRIRVILKLLHKSSPRRNRRRKRCKPAKQATDQSRLCRPFHGLAGLLRGKPRVPFGFGELHPGLLSAARLASPKLV